MGKTFSQTWIEMMGKIGLIALGIVYSLIGLLTFTAALNLGDDSEQGKVSQVLAWIQEQVFGQILLALITLGLLCYTFWRFIEAFMDTDKKGNGLRGLALRASYLSYGVMYAALTYYAAQLLFTRGTSGNDDETTRETLAQKLLELPYGRWLLGAFALGTAGVGIFQLYLSLSGAYRQIIEEKQIDTRAKEILVRSGMIGYIARAIVWLIIGYFLLQAALRADSSEAGDTDTALNYLEYQYGSLTLAVVGLGLVCYGIFMFVRAKYQPIVKN
jgi:hypothetical protein